MAIVTTHPIQYQAPFFRYLASRGISIEVLFLSDQGLRPRLDEDFGEVFAWDLPLLEGYRAQFPPALRSRGLGGFLDLIHPSLLWEIRRSRYCAVLVHGYRYLSMVLATVAASASGLPLLYRSDSTPSTSQLGRRGRVLSAALRRTGAICLSNGTRNDDFYAACGIPANRRVWAPYVVDNERFAAAAENFTKGESRDRLGLPRDARVALFSGKLVSWKRPSELLAAFAAVRRPGDVLCFAGTGPLRPELERQARGLGKTVRFLGFANQTVLPEMYRAADLLVLPSRHEPWGLVVNEAMACGLPVLVSDTVGCAPDLVQPGVTGWCVSGSTPGALEGGLREALADGERLRLMGLASRDRMRSWGFAEYADGILTALTAAGVRP